MDRKDVKSSLLKSVGYDAATETLEVEFLRSNGYVYRYLEVPMITALQMSQAESMGKFYLREIKPNFKCTRIEETDERKTKAEVEYSPEEQAEREEESRRKRDQEYEEE